MKLTLEMSRGAYRVLALLVHSEEAKDVVTDYVEDAEDKDKDPLIETKDLKELRNHILDICSDPLPDKKEKAYWKKGNKK